MRRAVKYKNLIAFAVVLVVLISITAVPAYAEFPPLTTGGRRIGSWILSALTALNITLSSTVSTSQGADIINFLADPFDVTYSYTEMWEDKPTIQIWNDYTTIDGVTYTDIWLSNEAAQKFKTDGLDFATAYSIASNTNGTFAEGAGFLSSNGETVNMFRLNGKTGYYSTGVNVPYSLGTYKLPIGYGIVSERWVPHYHALTWSNDGSTGVTDLGNTFQEGYYPKTLHTYNTGSGTSLQYYVEQADGGTGIYNVNYPASFTASPFDFDYTAGNIDASPLDPDQGIMIRVPSDTPGLKNFVTNNPYLTQPTEIDVTLDPDIVGKLDDLIDIIAPILVNLDSHDVQYIENHDAPAPVPDVPIVDATVDQVTQPIINEITNYGDQITQQIPNIIETIPTIDDICNNIDTAPYHDLDTGLDKLPTVFLPFITDLRSALGIWHYVTEWLGMIGASFAFVTGCLAGTAIMTPIYAAIAGYMCIKVYRRMTG